MKFAVLWASGKVEEEDFPDGCEWLVLPLPIFSSVDEVKFKRTEFVIHGENPYAPRVVFVEAGCSDATLEGYVNGLIRARALR